MSVPSYIVLRNKLPQVFLRASVTRIFKPIFRETITTREIIQRVFSRPLRRGVI